MSDHDAHSVASGAASDVELLALALSGERSATESLVAKLAPVVQARVGLALSRRLKQARGRNLKQYVEDLVQEVFVALFEQDGRILRNWNPDRGLSLKSFVGLVAEREVGMLLRTSKRNPFTEDPCDAIDLEIGADANDLDRRVLPESEAESNELLDLLLDELERRLSPQGLFVFKILFVEECSNEEAAALSGLSLDALYAWKSRISRLARTVRDRLTREMDPRIVPQDEGRAI